MAVGEKYRDRDRTWICKCVCGTTRSVLAYNLESGASTSCGCLTIENTRKALTKHGMTGGIKPIPVEYSAWSNMKSRCRDSSREDFKYYGGRGIKVCDRWMESFSNFFADMGRRPSDKHTIDRINVDGNYEPGNCRWATWTEQQNNKQLIKMCRRGHPFTPENTITISKTGRRLCRICNRRRDIQYKLKQKLATA